MAKQEHNIKILFVEDDLNLGFLTMEFLESEGFEVKLCKDGEAGLKAFKEQPFDFCLVDCMLPKMDGFQLVKEIRSFNTAIPVVFLTARSMKDDKQKGFTLGADDYLTKPFDEDELVWRIRAILKRRNAIPTENHRISIGQFMFDPTNQLLSIDNQVQRLTERETHVLYELTKNRGNITRRDDLLKAVWGEADYFSGRSLDVFIAKLRKYLKADSSVSIENIPRVGFLLKEI